MAASSPLRKNVALTSAPYNSPSIGPQPYLLAESEDPRGLNRVSPSRGDDVGIRPFTPYSPRPRSSQDKWSQDSMEGQRYKNQNFVIGLAHDNEVARQKLLHTSANQTREWVLKSEWQQAAEQDAREALTSKGGRGPIGPATITSARARSGPRDASAPAVKEVRERFQPVAKANAASRREAEDAEAEQRKAQDATTRALAEKQQIEARDRQSKHAELLNQSENLERRRLLIDAQKAGAAQRATKQRAEETAARDAAKKAEAALMKRIAEQKAKVDAARREAWQAQAHWPGAPGTSPRWNEQLSSDRKLKSRTLRRTANAATPVPPSVPSPRLRPVPAALFSRTPPGTKPTTPA